MNAKISSKHDNIHNNDVNYTLKSSNIIHCVKMFVIMDTSLSSHKHGFSIKMDRTKLTNENTKEESLPL